MRTDFKLSPGMFRGAIFSLTPLTEKATAWVERNLEFHATLKEKSVHKYIDWRDIEKYCRDILNEGLTIEQNFQEMFLTETGFGWRPFQKTRNKMNIEGKTIWQVAAGNGNTTHYADVCLKNDVIIIGSGRYGAWPDCEKEMRQKGRARKVGIVRRFAETIKPRDIIVLRMGTQQVFGVGLVIGDYDYSNLFGDVGEEHWDLRHVRRVRWLWHQDGKPELFPVYSLKLGSSVQYLTSPSVRRWLETLEIPEAAYYRPLQTL